MPDERRSGFARADWEAAKAEAQTYLAACARERRTTTYAGLCEVVTSVRLRPYSYAMVAFLDEICSGEDARLGIVMASLVTRKDTGMPGEGYFRAAERAGCDVSDPEGFWREQVEMVYRAYDDGTD